MQGIMYASEINVIVQGSVGAPKKSPSRDEKINRLKKLQTKIPTLVKGEIKISATQYKNVGSKIVSSKIFVSPEKRFIKIIVKVDINPKTNPKKNS